MSRNKYIIIKVVIDPDIEPEVVIELCEKTERLTEKKNQIMTENKKIQSGIVIAKNGNLKLEEKIKKNRRKGSNIAAETT